MSFEILTYINNLMKAQGINYSLERNNQNDITYPYWTADVVEGEYNPESSHKSVSIILTGVSNKTWTQLMRESNNIEKLFRDRIIKSENSAFAFFYEGCDMIPSQNETIKSVRITLSVESWSNT